MIFSERRGGAAVAAVRTQSRFMTRGGRSSGGGLFKLSLFFYFFANPTDILLTPRVHDFYRAQGGGSGGGGADMIAIYDKGAAAAAAGYLRWVYFFC
jgi:uncharacterized membrane protein YgcG